ncbi:tam [Symbiodinium pilosum]|uniref:Tam protein n=1 Tax=Symbiodinium pilosum TaxID=2952 RepID=A0A812MFD6_SYMPI|nr:tam [Symbiodinium pilosum]
MRPDFDELDFSWLVVQQVTPHIRARCSGTSAVVVSSTTIDYRSLARHLVSGEDHVIEIGSSLGHCTEILHARAADVLGLDVSVAQLVESRSRLPGVAFEFLDIFQEQDRLASFPQALRCNQVFLDIGGDRAKGCLDFPFSTYRRSCTASVSCDAASKKQD